MAPVNPSENLAVPLQMQMTKNYTKATDSEYLGIPNDLYPAYRNTVPTYTRYDERKDQDATFKVASVSVPAPEGPVANDTCSDIDKCDTAQENPAFASRFTAQIKPGQAAAPAHVPDFAHYTTQYSTVGNAFAPVGQPQVSEYQFEDLNDLASCIDAI
ncbi:hypothetical protein OESDEN_12555 [Oesophagostomum dentatum]|uniref:Uncharacterized protein n=1 Tax=Oesophagostomum dentatum TaxID=61180 RepID=A0A0B1SRW5_OESDE|nr:hypothetical protein OESDEN_12555 [Oesophagostomum dentatum]